MLLKWYSLYFFPLSSCLVVSAIEILSAITYFCSYINSDESCCKWGWLVSFYRSSSESLSFVATTLNHYWFVGSSYIFILLVWLKYLCSFSLASFPCWHADSVANCSVAGLYLFAHDFGTAGDSALSLR